MSTTLLPHTESTAAPFIGAGPLLIATDGTERADGAVCAAQLLAARSGASADIVSVVESFPIVAPEIQLPATPELEAARRSDRLRDVRAQLARLTGSDRTWPLELRHGFPPGQIVEKARESTAKIIIVGLGRHGIIDRLFGDETALQLLRTSTVPVLAVPPNIDRLPSHAVVGMDFSASAIRAARIAVELLGEGGALSLVHVVPRDLESAVRELHNEYEMSLQSSFEQVIRQLDVSPSVSVETIILRGDPAHEILRFASRVKADLIAAGSHGHGFFSRLLLGSVATKLLRGASCAVLGVPLTFMNFAEAERASRSDQESSSIAREQWTDMLDGFTRRNIGRRASVEVDDPELGAQAQEHDYPLLGVTYDRHDARVDIMLGELGSTSRHLTRSIGDVRAIDLLRDPEQHDLALRLQHGAGQTLLTLAR
jgi:nucleotide-binding universal stress UspA family protein